MLSCRPDEALDLQTNFVSDQPSSWYAELYKRDQLTGGHVIMLGADAASRWANTSAAVVCKENQHATGKCGKASYTTAPAADITASAAVVCAIFLHVAGLQFVQYLSTQ